MLGQRLNYGHATSIECKAGTCPHLLFCLIPRDYIQGRCAVVASAEGSCCQEECRCDRGPVEGGIPGNMKFKA
jgi:hypothetical protein